MAKTVLEFEKPIIELEQKVEEMRRYADSLDIADEIRTMEEKILALRKGIFSNLTRWQKVQLARHPDRNPGGPPCATPCSRSSAARPNSRSSSPAR